MKDNEINIIGDINFKSDIIITTKKFEKEMTIFWNNSDKDFVLTLKPGTKLIIRLQETNVTDGISKENES